MFLTKRFYLIFVILTLLMGMGYVYGLLFMAAKVLLGVFALFVMADGVLLYHRNSIDAWRQCAERFSNGDANEVRIKLESSYPFAVRLTIIDEAPAVFQRRDIVYSAILIAKGQGTVSYRLTPVQRGVYTFGHIRCFVRTALGLVERRYTCGEAQEVKVYPSYLMLNRYELLALSNNLTEMGIKRIRRGGNNTEFEQVKDYVQGDDYRKINWKVSARRHQLMVNAYRDERSQQIFSVIDKGRVMQQSFRGMTLLDYSINAALVLSYVAMHRDDKAGLITFADKLDTFIAPSRHMAQMQHLQEGLYAQETTFGETDFSNLCANVHKLVSKRSLLVVYTNFSGMTALNRQLAYLKLLSQWHRVLVVFFEDIEMNDYIHSPKTSTEDYYQHVIAEKFANEKRLIVSTLRQHGILSLLTTPDSLSVDVINKYLEMKQRQILT
jgi:uncharacterized protein (DUF58 family)